MQRKVLEGLQVEIMEISQKGSNDSVQSMVLMYM